MSVPAALSRAVVRRAGNRCEYCGLSQAGQEAQFHVDDVEPVASGGLTVSENLALACVSCSLRKGARVELVDPKTGKLAAVFNPRRQRWSDHFEWRGSRVFGKTPVGRAAVVGLKLNRALALAIRSEEAERGRHPPPAG